MAGARENAYNYPACACCKLQRRRCEETCELAPYFPSDRLKEFQNAHRLFGVSNIQKMIASVKESQRQDTADSLLTEGNSRKSDPVQGCYGIILSLKSRLEFAESQLAAANRWLAFYREMEKSGKVISRRDDQGTAGHVEQMILSRPRGGSSVPMQASPVLTLRPPTPHAPVQDEQMLDGVEFPRAVDHMNTEAHKEGYVYQSTLEEGADYLSPFEPQLLDQMVESNFQRGKILGGFHEVGDQFSFKEIAKHIVREEEGGGGSSTKGKEVVEDED